MATAEIVPNAQNNSEVNHTLWTGAYTDVDEGSGAINTSDLITTNVNGRREYYDWSTEPALGLPGTTISQIEFFYHAKKANNGSFIPQIYNAGTYYNGTTPSLTTSYDTYSTVWTTNPSTSAAWTSGEIDAIIAGFMNTNPRGAGNITYVATTWIIVTYIEAAGYGNDVISVASANIGSINGIATADISKVNGV